MIRLKNILVEEEPKKPSEDPNKILVKNKETGQSYYINKDNFDPSLHEKPEAKKEKKKEDTPEKQGTDSSEKKSATGKVDASSDPIAAAFGDIDKKQKKAKEKIDKEKEKKLSPIEKMEKEIEIKYQSE